MKKWRWKKSSRNWSGKSSTRQNDDQFTLMLECSGPGAPDHSHLFLSYPPAKERQLPGMGFKNSGSRLSLTWSQCLVSVSKSLTQPGRGRATVADVMEHTRILLLRLWLYYVFHCSPPSCSILSNDSGIYLPPPPPHGRPTRRPGWRIPSQLSLLVSPGAMALLMVGTSN
jgi:hypothetical protein